MSNVLLFGHVTVTVTYMYVRYMYEHVLYMYVHKLTKLFHAYKHIILSG